MPEYGSFKDERSRTIDDKDSCVDKISRIGKGRLLLLAEMKLPGEAWLEFKIENDQLVQKATFRPLGVWGRVYWYSVLPFHGVIFNGMLKSLASKKRE